MVVPELQARRTNEMQDLHQSVNRRVAGSSPARIAKFQWFFEAESRRVASLCPFLCPPLLGESARGRERFFFDFSAASHRAQQRLTITTCESRRCLVVSSPHRATISARVANATSRFRWPRERRGPRQPPYQSPAWFRGGSAQARRPIPSAFSDDLKPDTSHARFDDNLRSLEGQGLIEARRVTHFRDGTVADVVSVTPGGQSVLDRHRGPVHDSGLPPVHRPLYAALGEEDNRHSMVFTLIVPARSDSCHPPGARRPRQGRGSPCWPRRAKCAEP
jgi:hypothetical protein